MRDAFGGVFTMNIMLVFIFIFVAFSAVSLNYAKAFRLKNSIIDFVEENEIIRLGDISTRGLQDSQLAAIIANANYNKTCDSIGLSQDTVVTEDSISTYCYNGVVIVTDKTTTKVTNNDDHIKTNEITYTVITYADWNMGALNKILFLAGKPGDADNTLNSSWEIKGKAKVIARVR